MRPPSELDSPQRSAGYLRWTPERAPWPIEIDLELVARIIKHIAESHRLGIETGGVLTGSFPNAVVPALRIEGFEVIPRRADDGPIFLLDGQQTDQFTAARQKAYRRGTSAVGFFRSHLRPGPLKPSLADKSLLSKQFKKTSYIALLIESQKPRHAAYFLAAGGQLSQEPVEEFVFDEEALSSLSQPRPAPPPPAMRPEPIHKKITPAGRSRWLAVFSALAAILAILLILLLKGTFVSPSSDHIQLAAEVHNRVLQISWNRQMPEILKTEKAVLTIADGGRDRTVQLGRDDLQYGVVDYEPSSNRVSVTLALGLSESQSISQSVEWTGSKP